MTRWCCRRYKYRKGIKMNEYINILYIYRDILYNTVYHGTPRSQTAYRLLIIIIILYYYYYYYYYYCIT